MKIARHIFRKDVRYLRFEIAVFIAVAVIFAWGLSGPLAEPVVLLLIVGAVHLTSRAVHAEAIPGTGQFWITRPYPWGGLLVAKLLFIAVCIDLPVGAARLMALAIQRYPIVPSVPALLWSQLLFFCALVPVAALAALTAGIMEFSIGMLLLALAYLAGFFVLPFAVRQTFWPVSVEWMHVAAAVTVLAAAGAAILFWQYRDRRTGFSRVFAVSAALVAAALYIALPASTGFAVESRLCPGAPPRFEIKAAPGTKNAVQLFSPGGRRDPGTVRLPLTLAVSGLPEGAEAAADALYVGLDWPNGKTWSGKATVSRMESAEERRFISAAMDVPFGLFREIQEPAHVHGSLYLTLFGNAESRTIPFTSQPVNSQDGLQCYSGFNSKVRDRDSFNQYSCRAFFGWPSRLVYARAGDHAADKQTEFTRLVSYSPFPSGLDLNSEESRYTTLVLNDAQSTGGIERVTITTKKPLAHMHRDFDLTGVRIADFNLPHDRSHAAALTLYGQ